MHRRRQRAAVLALLCGALYFFTQGLAVLFRGGKPYLKVLKHVDLDLPIYWLFKLARILGLYQPVFIAGHSELSFFTQFRPVALGTLTYIALGYLLGFFLPVSRTPHGREAAGARLRQ